MSAPRIRPRIVSSLGFINEVVVFCRQYSTPQRARRNPPAELNERAARALAAAAVSVNQRRSFQIWVLDGIPGNAPRRLVSGTPLQYQSAQHGCRERNGFVSGSEPRRTQTKTKGTSPRCLESFGDANRANGGESDRGHAGCKLACSTEDECWWGRASSVHTQSSIVLSTPCRRSI